MENRSVILLVDRQNDPNQNHEREEHDIFRIIIIYKRIKSYHFLLLISNIIVFLRIKSYRNEQPSLQFQTGH